MLRFSHISLSIYIRVSRNWCSFLQLRPNVTQDELQKSFHKYVLGIKLNSMVARISKWDQSQNYTYCQYVRLCMVYAHTHACIPPIFCDRATTSFRICFVDVWNATSKWTPERSLDRTTLWPWCLQWSIICLFGSKIQESIQPWQQLCEASAVLWTIASLPLYILLINQVKLNWKIIYWAIKHYKQLQYWPYWGSAQSSLSLSGGMLKQMN